MSIRSGNLANVHVNTKNLAVVQSPFCLDFIEDKGTPPVPVMAKHNLLGRAVLPRIATPAGESHPTHQWNAKQRVFSINIFYSEVFLARECKT